MTRRTRHHCHIEVYTDERPILCPQYRAQGIQVLVQNRLFTTPHEHQVKITRKPCENATTQHKHIFFLNKKKNEDA